MAVSWIAGLVTGLAALHFLQKRFFPYFWLDLRYMLKVIGYGLEIEKYKKNGHVVSVVDRFVQQAQRIPDKPFIIFHGEVHTYGDMDKRSNRVANVFMKHTTLKKGDTVAMLMNNEPDFINVWFGLVKLGCLVAFLNYNIRSRSLLHCFHSCGAKILIVGADMLDSVEEILPNLREDNISVWVMAAETTLPGVNTVLDKLDTVSDEPVPQELRFVSSIKAATLFIFTSGTTGLPKAAVISQLQALKGAAGIWAFGGTPDDIVYITLPLYHSAASLIGIGGCVYLGTTCVLRKKFSASKFWDDCKTYKVTVFQYIGELCRYLCKQPVRENEKDHKVRMAVGNGVRTDVWKDFITRFGDIKICELYGATEGNVCFMNHTGKIGSVGRSNFFYKLLIPFELIKYDIQKDEPIKNKDGWCERVKNGEAGLLISRVNHANPFFGYAGNKKNTTKKLLCDVFKKGDVFFNTGDLMVQDHDGFLYFRDRIGDTFRWKGENVATTEVSDIIGMLDFIQEANVYGVEVPGHEGKVGMVSIILKPGMSLDIKSIYEHVMNYLPGYAYPRFLRLQKNMEITGTFKQQKFRLVEQGFNPLLISDPLYFLDDSQKSYVPMTKDIHDKIFNEGIGEELHNVEFYKKAIHTTDSIKELEWLKKRLQQKYGGTDTSEPCFPENPTCSTLDNSSDSIENEESDSSRVGNNQWCTCSNCKPMPTAIESICCKEILNIELYVTETGCVIEHEYFQQFCRDRGRVEVSMRAIGEVLCPPPDQDLNRSSS